MRKKKILIIEDDLIFADEAARILRSLGYSVTTLPTVGKRALSRVGKENPNLVLINIKAGDRSQGIEMARSISEGLDIPVILIGARSEIKMIKTALKKLPCGYLLKPVDESNLEMAIEMALARHSLEKKSRDRTRKALSESEERYQHLVDNISEGIIIQDKNGIMTSANEKFLAMTGYKREEVIGRPITELLGEGWLRKDEGLKTRGNEARWKSVELAWRRKDGKRVYTILSQKPLYDVRGRFQGSVAVLTDITDRRDVEMELRRSHEELRNLSQHIQSVREKESKRIAGEIHDELGQQLTALKMDLSWLSYRVSYYEKNREKIIEKISMMSDLIDKTIQTVQKISAELRPGLLDDLGLVPAIEWLAQDFQNRTNIICKVHFSCDEIELDPDCSTAVYRISQEALTNVARHAKASRVDIFLKQKDGTLVLEISDNGRGIRDNEIYAPTSLGLMGMRERARPFGGELIIIGTPKKGTTLMLSLPLGRG
jgi:two-component system sensor histidine kinase UhpB